MPGLHKILIIDDESDNLDALKRLLRKDFEVTAALSGEEALKIVEESPAPFDALISDQRMPGLTGSEFFERVQKLDPKATRVLLTGFADLEAIIEAVNRGHIWRYVAKPWEPEDLKITIRQACERTQMQRSLDASLAELSRTLIELRAKDWARERLFKILLHEFRTAPQIIEAVKALESDDESSPERRRFLERLSERFQLLESDINDLLNDEKQMAQLPKEKLPLKELLSAFATQYHLQIENLNSLGDEHKVTVHQESFAQALVKIFELLKENTSEAPVTLNVDLLDSSSSASPRNVFLTFGISSPGQKILPKGLSKQSLEAPLAWRALLEPFVGVEDFERHSQGLRIEVARVLRQLAAMGIRFDVQVAKNMDQVEFILDIKIP